MTDAPLLIFFISMAALALAAWLGAVIRGRRAMEGEAREDFAVVLASALTLLGLIIGFTFSMAISRYDLRKSYEEAEANAIGTEYVRAQLLPAADAAHVEDLLRRYTDARIAFYSERSEVDVAAINDKTGELQNELWAAVKTPATAEPTAVVALAVAGMNDVLNSQGYTQAAWWNRIPIAAWLLMGVIAMLCNGMIGYAGGKLETRRLLLLVLPFVVSVSFLLIADIDSPRGGIIRVNPQNLASLRDSLRP